MKAAARKLFDIREGEFGKTALMFLYLMFVLFGYYILKPVSRAMFVNRFDIDKLPILYVLIAACGGVLAYSYSKVAVKASLTKAVNWATAITLVCIGLLWWLLRLRLEWVLYVFNIWVSLFSIVTVSQGWLLAANVFDSRQAKRLYGLLGTGAIIGAAFGGSFTRVMVSRIGNENLVLACGVMVVFSYVCFRLLLMQKGVSLAGAKAAETEETEFSAQDLLAAIGRYRHLQVIMGIILMTYIVDVLIEFQFNAAAKIQYPDAHDLTAFMGTFYGLYLNAVSFTFQFFLTALIVRAIGVGGTLLILPVSMLGASVGIFALPGLLMSALARLIEAAARYSFNRTGMELLYLPLPAELKNRTKAFVDIFVDRAGRGLGGGLLILATSVLHLDLRQTALLVVVFCGAWIVLSLLARREYISTVRRRLELRRLDLESLRLPVGDPAVLQLLEDIANSAGPRQACYALSVLAEAPGYPIEPLLEALVPSQQSDIRAVVYEIARRRRFPGLLRQAEAEVAEPVVAAHSSAVRPAILYLLALSEDPGVLAQRLLDSRVPAFCRSALEYLDTEEDLAAELIGRDWLSALCQSEDPELRALAAMAIGVRGDRGIEILHTLLEDRSPEVVKAACRAAGKLKTRAYLPALLRRLADPNVRGAAIEALTEYGTRITGMLGDLLEDPAVPMAVRRQIPRVLQATPDQRHVDLLLKTLNQADIGLRQAILKALNRLRDEAPKLDYGIASVQQQALSEARAYLTFRAALEPLRASAAPGPATTLLVRTLEDRLRQTVERLFRLLGLCYPPKEIYSAYLAVNQGPGERMSAALEFLDNVLERELKRVLLPLLESSQNLEEVGRELFGLEELNTQRAVRDLIQSGDPWLSLCASAAAGELLLRELASDIQQAAARGGPEARAVARSALAALA